MTETSQSYIEIGQRLHRAREESRLTLEDVAKYLGCSIVAVQYYEKGKRRISIEDLIKVSNLLRKPLSYFFAKRPDFPSRDEMIETAYQQVCADPKYAFASRDTVLIPMHIKLGIVQLYQEATGKRLLSEDFDAW